MGYGIPPAVKVAHGLMKNGKDQTSRNLSLNSHPTERMQEDVVNPWLDLPSRSPFVLAEDRPSIDAFNSRLPPASPFRIATEDVIPEPFVGRVKTAPVLVLQLNPGQTRRTPPPTRTRLSAQRYLQPPACRHGMAFLLSEPSVPDLAPWRCLVDWQDKEAS